MTLRELALYLTAGGSAAGTALCWRSIAITALGLVAALTKNEERHKRTIAAIEALKWRRRK